MNTNMANKEIIEGMTCMGGIAIQQSKKVSDKLKLEKIDITISGLAEQMSEYMVQQNNEIANIVKENLKKEIENILRYFLSKIDYSSMVREILNRIDKKQ